MYINTKNEINKKLILVEYDAGYISPKSEQNSYILESTNMLDHSKPFEFYGFTKI